MAEPKEPQVMSTSDALNEIGKMKSMFRACEQAENVMLAVQRAEAQKVDLDNQIKDLRSKQKSAQADLNSTNTALAEKQKSVDNYLKSLDAKKKTATDEFDVAMARLNEHYSLTSVAARDKVAEDLKAEQAKVDELTAKRSDLQRDVRMLQAEKAALERSARPPSGVV